MSLSTTPYDPQDPEDRPSGSGYFSGRDLKKVLIILVILFGLVYPIYLKLKDDRNKHVCKAHLEEIMKSALIYAATNTDRLPPVFAMDSSGVPIMSDESRVTSWISVLSGLMKEPKMQFTCPSASEAEHVANTGNDAATIYSDYGMFGGVSAAPIYGIADQAGTTVFAESSNGGAADTYDPFPFLDAAGKPMPDGFLIGFDNTNFQPNETLAVFRKSKFATRLAFKKTGKGEFPVDSPGRHGDSIHMLYADGHLKTVKAPVARITRLGDEIIKTWALK